jgi:hypothetical protein
MAVELAKVSLWLITMMKGRPFSFLDHALKCGDSLLGISSLKQIENFSLRPGDRQVTFATANLFRYVEEARKKRGELEALPSNDYKQIEAKSRLNSEAETATAKVKALADCLISFELRGIDGEQYEQQRAISADHAEVAMRKPLPEFQAYARDQLRGRRPFHWPVEFPEIFASGGFSAFVGNPPFMWGMRISTAFGSDYLTYLQQRVGRRLGAADYCTHFFLRAAQLLMQNGCFGLLATDTISKGDTREVGLDQIVSDGCLITRAIETMHWPGNASVRVAIIHVRKGQWNGVSVLNGQAVATISSNLEASGDFKPKPLAASADIAFIGHYPMSLGFVLADDEAKHLRNNSRNHEVIFPYLIGDDVNSDPNQLASRWIINFREKSEAEAAQFAECFSIVRQGVKPERDSAKQASTRGNWWLYARTRPAMMKVIGASAHVFVQPFVSKYIAPVKVPSSQVFAAPMVVIAKNGEDLFPILQSSLYDRFVRTLATNLGGTLRYAPSDCFETFPFPTKATSLTKLGIVYHEFRSQTMLSRQEGLTKTYNRFHSVSEKSEDIARLRGFHVGMDQAVADAYGWSDLDLSHGFHETKQGVRYTISESARRTILAKLLELNHQRYAQEVKAGLHEKKKGKGKRRKADDGQEGLL